MTQSSAVRLDANRVVTQQKPSWPCSISQSSILSLESSWPPPHSASLLSPSLPGLSSPRKTTPILETCKVWVGFSVLKTITHIWQIIPLGPAPGLNGPTPSIRRFVQAPSLSGLALNRDNDAISMSGSLQRFYHSVIQTHRFFQCIFPNSPQYKTSGSQFLTTGTRPRYTSTSPVLITFL